MSSRSGCFTATLLLTLAIWLITLLSGCANSTAPTNAVDAEALVRQQWALTTLNGKALLPDSNIDLRFENGSASGNAGCNSYGGEYKLDGSKLSIGTIVSTEMACADNAKMQQEGEYLKALSETAGVRMQDNRLELTNANGDVTLVFTKR